MLANPMDVLTAYPVRKTKKQKQAFRDAVLSYAREQGYAVVVEQGFFGTQNVILGDPASASYLVTAHYDTSATQTNIQDNTSGIVTLLEIARTMPENRRNRVCFVLFDLGRIGMIGASSFYWKHKASASNQIVLNLDCVGYGDRIRLFPAKALRNNRKKLTSLYKACGYIGKKDILVQEKGRFPGRSDHEKFPYGAGICALDEKGKRSENHPSLDETNINILRAALTTFICCDAAQ